MAVLGFGNYLCEACKNFDADGIDGNSPSCLHGFKAMHLTDECHMFDLGIPYGYNATRCQRARRAHEVAGMLFEQEVGE